MDMLYNQMQYTFTQINELAILIAQITEKEIFIREYISFESEETYVDRYVDERYKFGCFRQLVTFFLTIICSGVMLVLMVDYVTTHTLAALAYVVISYIVIPVAIYMLFSTRERRRLAKPGRVEYEKYKNERVKKQLEAEKKQEEVEMLESKLMAIEKECALPIKYWPYASLICQYANAGRAETLEEAIEILEQDIKHSEEIAQLEQKLADMKNQHEQMKWVAEQMKEARIASEQAESDAKTNMYANL